MGRADASNHEFHRCSANAIVEARRQGAQIMGSNGNSVRILETVAAGNTTGHSQGFAGFLGNSDAWIEINDSRFTGNVQSRYDVGGFFGYKWNHDAWFHRCASAGTVHNSGAYDRIGGFIGIARYNARFLHCNSSARVTGRYRVGGFVGDNNRTRYEYCQSSAYVRASRG